MMKSFLAKRKFDLESDRLGPDCPFSHWRLYFKPYMKAIARRRFKDFGENAEFRAGAYAIVCSKISLGDNVIIRPNTMLFAYPNESEEGSITIENNVMLGSGVHIYVSSHRYDQDGQDIIYQGHFPPKSVTLKEGCWIGANAVIFPGVTIGKNSVVGAGSIVTKSFGERVVVAGNPAKVIKTL